MNEEREREREKKVIKLDFPLNLDALIEIERLRSYI